MQVLPGVAWAAQADYGFGYLGEYRSNIRQQPNNDTNEWINVGLAGFTYSENTADFVTHITSQAEYRDYRRETFADETLFFLDASSVWTLSPGRLTWTAVDAYREVTLDATQADTPANRTGANVLETGPDAFFRLGSANTLSLGARYGDVHVRESDLDNNRYGGVVRWIYQSTAQTSYSLNLEQVRVEFENDTTNENFRRQDSFLRVQTRSAHAEITLDGGRTEFDRARSSDLDSSLARLTWRQNLTSISTFGVSASSGYQDLGTELLRYVTPPTTSVSVTAPPPPATDIVSNGLYHSKRADMFYSYRGNRLTWNGGVVARDVDFEAAATEDQKEKGANFDASYLVSGVTTLSLMTSLLDLEFLTSGREDKETQMWLRLAYRAQRELTVGLDVGRVKRDSNDPAHDFVDNRIYLSVLWSTGPLFSPLSRGRR